MTKQIITTKLKAIRQKYRQAVDSGRYSGHGRVVLLYYEICEKVWGGSPATEQLESGIESNDLSISLEKLPTTAVTSTGTSSTDNDPEDDDAQDGDVEDEIVTERTTVISPDTVNKRRQFLHKTLGEYKQEKLKRKLPIDAQLLECSQEDIKFKKTLN